MGGGTELWKLKQGEFQKGPSDHEAKGQECEVGSWRGRLWGFSLQLGHC